MWQGLAFQNTASSLSDPINTLWRGRRTALPRQQTLRATIEWSYNLLTTEERLLLNCLSVFAGPFTEAMRGLVDSQGFFSMRDVLGRAFRPAIEVARIDIPRRRAHFVY